MVIEIDDMILKDVRVVLKGEDNDVYICRDENAIAKTCYTLLYVKNHIFARQLIDIYEENQRSKELVKKEFAFEQGFCFLYEYEKERPLELFYMGRAFPLTRCENICVNVVLQCLSGILPYPLLYLVLTQNLINISAEDSIYFNNYFDLKDFDIERSEKDCAIACAILIQKLLQEHEEEKAVSYKLISRKITREGYRKFSELYKDIRLSSAQDNKKGIIAKIIRFFKKRREFFYKVLYAGAVILVITMILSFISTKITGNNIFTVLFSNTFLQIGTESMLQ